jgi:hypothetical protein
MYISIYKCHNLVSKDQLSYAITLPSPHNEKPTSSQLLLYAVLTMSAQHIGDKVHATEFFHRARNQAMALFDQSDYAIACMYFRGIFFVDHY